MVCRRQDAGRSRRWRPCATGDTVFVPKNWEKTYFDWLENIQPWCISRQLWWGHQIPAWYAPWGAVYVAETEEEALADALADGVDARDSRPTPRREAIAGDPERAADLLARDEDVLDTWFSSALWPFSRSAGRMRPRISSGFYPTDVLVTGFDIIFFWVARMMMFGPALHGRNPLPRRLSSTRSSATRRARKCRSRRAT